MVTFEDIFSVCNCPAVITNRNNIYYQSGFSGEGLLFITKNRGYIITDSRYEIAVRESCGNNFTCIIGNCYYEILNTIIIQNKITSVAIENNEISYKDFLKIKSFNVTVENLNSFFNEIRMEKNSFEISNIFNAARITDCVFDKTLSFIHEGISEIELAAFIDYHMKLLGADGNAFETIVAFNENSAKPHAIPGNTKLKNNSVVLLDFGCSFNHYCSDMTRTFIYGKATDYFKKVYQIVLDANNKAIDAVNKNVTGYEVDYAARSHIDNEGFGEFFQHGTGHGVGLQCHELPVISFRNKEKLPKNTFFTIEPGIYLETEFGVRVEDLLYLGDNEKIILSKSNKEFMQV